MEESESGDWLSTLLGIPTPRATASSIFLQRVATPTPSINKANNSEGRLGIDNEIFIRTTSRTITLVEAKRNPTPSQGGIIALGIICGLLIFGILLFILLYCHYRRQKLDTQNAEAVVPRPRNPHRPQFPTGRTPREEHPENGPQNGGFYHPMPQGQNYHEQQSPQGRGYSTMGTPLNRMREYPPGYVVSNQQPAPMARMRGVEYPPQIYMPVPEYGQATQGVPPADPQAYGFGNYHPYRGSGQIHRSVREGSSTGEPPKWEMGRGPELMRRVPSLGSRRSSNAGNMRGPPLAVI